MRKPLAITLRPPVLKPGRKQSHNGLDPRLIEFARILARRAALRDHEAEASRKSSTKKAGHYDA